MATGKRYYWMKLKESFMTSDTVDYFMSQPNGANYVVLYQMLCLKTINTGGRLSRQIGEIIIPYDVDKIVRDCKWFSADTVRIALNLYKAFGLIYEEVDGVLTLTDHNGLVGSETDWKDQKAAQRAKDLPALEECRRLNGSMLRLPSGKVQYVDEKRYGGNGMLAFDLAGGMCEMCGDTENLLIHHANGYSNEPEDLYILCKSCHGKAHSPSTPTDWLHHTWRKTADDKGTADDEGTADDGGGQVHTPVHTPVHTDIRDKILDTRDKILDTRDTHSNVSADIQSVMDAWNSIGLTTIREIKPDSTRGKMTKARLKEYGLDEVLRAIELVRNSSFLMGNGNRGWQATFDWLIAPSNFQKVIEGTYTHNEQPKEQPKMEVQTDKGKAEMAKYVQRLKNRGQT